MDTKKYTIVVDGVKEAIEDIKTLKETLEDVANAVESSTKAAIENVNSLKSAFEGVPATIETITKTDTMESVSTSVEASTKAAIESINALKEAMETIPTTVETVAKVETEHSKAKKESATATDELGKVQKKLNEYDAEYQAQVAKAKSELKAKNEEVKNALKFEQDLQIIETASMDTYKEKQTYLSALNRVIRNMTDEETLNGKGKEELIKISAEVQQSLKDEDEQMKIYVRNVGNYKSAVEDLEKPHKSLKAELKELKMEMAQMLVDGVSPLDEGFREMAERAGTISDAIGDAGAEIEHFASDTSAMDNVVNVATTATAAYGLMISSMQTLGIENEDVINGIQKLEAAQTALNSLNSLSSSLLDNSTASYKIYHTILQAVGLEKKTVAAATTALNAAQTAESAGAAGATTATTALTAAEGAEAVGATTAASATMAFAASLWAVLSPLLAIVAIIGVVAAGIYGLVEAYNAIFGPTAEETAAMEAQCQVMDNLNAKTAEHIELLKAQSDEEAQVINESIQLYEDNLKALSEHLEKCKEFYGEDSDEYKKALEEKEKAELEYEKFQNDGLEYLTKIAHQAREKDKEETMGKFDYQRKKAEESYNYQVALMRNLVKLGKITAAQEKQMLADLQLAYTQAKKQIDKDEKGYNANQNRKTNITRGTGGSSKKSTQASEAEKAAAEFKKVAKEFSKAIEQMSQKTNDATLARQKELLNEARDLANKIVPIDKETYDKRMAAEKAYYDSKMKILTADQSKEIAALDKDYAEKQEKYKGHEDQLVEYQKQVELQKNIINERYRDLRVKNDNEFYTKREEIQKAYEVRGQVELNNIYDTITKKTKKNIEESMNLIIKAEVKKSSKIKKQQEDNSEEQIESFADLQKKYEEMIPDTSKVLDENQKLWKKFWELPPDADKWVEKFGEVQARGEEFTDFLREQSLKAEEILEEMMESNDGTISDFQKQVVEYYHQSFGNILDMSNLMKAEGKSEQDIINAQLSSYATLVQQMGEYRQMLIEMGIAVGDYASEMNALGEVVESTPTDGLQKSEKAAKKWGVAMSKFLNKYVAPFQDAFNKMGDAVNGVFDAMNDWIQVDIDKLADALEEITEKYDELSEAVENTEDTISSLKDEFKSATGSDKEQLAQKIADEEALLATEKAAQQEAYNTQMELDEKKQELENEQQKRELSQQQFSAGISLISSLISTAEGMSKEYSKGILGIPTAVLIGVLGGIQSAAITAQIAALQAQKGRYAEGGYVDDNGMLQGPLHSEGGIDIKVGKKGKIIEAEGGEFIINRKSSAKYFDLLTEINDYGKTGKTISGFNQTKFANGGSLNFERVNETLNDKQTQKQMQRAMENITISPKVSVVDIIKKTKDYNRVRTYAGR